MPLFEALPQLVGFALLFSTVMLLVAPVVGIRRPRVADLVPLAAAVAWVVAILAAAIDGDLTMIFICAAFGVVAYQCYKLFEADRTGRRAYLLVVTARVGNWWKSRHGQRGWLRLLAERAPGGRGSALTLDELRIEYAATVLHDAQTDPLLNALLDEAAGIAVTKLSNPLLKDAEWLTPRLRLAIWANHNLNAMARGEELERPYGSYPIGLLNVAGAVRAADRLAKAR